MSDRGQALDIVLKVFLVLALVALNGFFVAAEFALVKLRDTQLNALVLKGSRRARTARAILADLNSFLAATQLGVTMASLGLGWAGQPVFMAHYHQRFRRQPAIRHQFLRIREGHYLISLGMQDDRAGLRRPGRSPFLPGRAEQNQRRRTRIDVHGYGPTPA